MRFALAAAAVVGVGVGVVGCKKKGPAPIQVAPPSVESPLQIVSLSPSGIGPGAPAQVTLFGSGFTRDVEIGVGDQRATAVTYRNGNQIGATLPALEEGTYDVSARNPTTGATDVLRGGLRVMDLDLGSPCQFVVLYFDTDTAELTRSAENTLTTLVSCYATSADPIRVDGHADERGTTDYNLALSYRRALVVQSFLTEHGVDKARLPVSSYGEERPAESGGTEEAWARNRRVELTLDRK